MRSKRDAGATSAELRWCKVFFLAFSANAIQQMIMDDDEDYGRQKYHDNDAFLACIFPSSYHRFFSPTLQVLIGKP